MRISPIRAAGAGGLALAAAVAGQSTTAPAASSTTLATSTTVSAATQTPTACAAGLQLFVARGSTEPAGVGRVGVVADAIVGRVPGSAITAVDYPASFLDYTESVANGTEKLADLVADYGARCPSGLVALLGYSQGAQAAADLICGTSSSGFNKTADLDAKYLNNIVAIILFGDPTRAPSQPWNLGTATNRSGLFPRRDNAACDPFSPRMASWCDAGDRYCDQGNISSVHGSYFANYTAAAADFAVAQLDKVRLGNESAATPTGAAPRSLGGPGPAAAFAAAALGAFWLFL